MKTTGNATEMPITVLLAIPIWAGGCDGTCEGSRLPVRDGILTGSVCDGVGHSRLLSDDCQRTWIPRALIIGVVIVRLPSESRKPVDIRGNFVNVEGLSRNSLVVVVHCATGPQSASPEPLLQVNESIL